jgi:hypothetical protein
MMRTITTSTMKMIMLRAKRDLRVILLGSVRTKAAGAAGAAGTGGAAGAEGEAGISGPAGLRCAAGNGCGAGS